MSKEREFSKVAYRHLNARQKENYNFHKIAALLADFGFSCMRLYDDWQGADFIAQHVDGQTFLKVQLKARLCFYKKYLDKQLFIAFPDEGDWYLYPHDQLLNEVLSSMDIISGTRSWDEAGGYSINRLNDQLRHLLGPYKVASPDLRIVSF